MFSLAWKLALVVMGRRPRCSRASYDVKRLHVIVIAEMLKLDVSTKLLRGTMMSRSAEQTVRAAAAGAAQAEKNAQEQTTKANAEADPPLFRKRNPARHALPLGPLVLVRGEADMYG